MPEYSLASRSLPAPPGPHTGGLRFAVEPSRGAPRELVVEYAWPGPWQGATGMKPPPDPRMTDVEGEMQA